MFILYLVINIFYDNYKLILYDYDNLSIEHKEEIKVIFHKSMDLLIGRVFDDDDDDDDDDDIFCVR